MSSHVVPVDTESAFLFKGFAEAAAVEVTNLLN